MLNTVKPTTNADLTYTEVNNGGTSPALAANSVRLAIVVTNGSTITSVLTTTYPNNAPEVRPTNPSMSGCIGYSQITSDWSSSDSSATPQDITGLSTTVTIPTGGRRCKVTLDLGQIITTAAGTPNLLRAYIRESSTTLAMCQQSIAQNYYTNLKVSYVGALTAGTHTFKGSMDQNNAGTMYAKAGTTIPSYIMVELI
jgi:hypothetical protein